MARRRSRNEGSIYFIKKKGLWAGQITLPDGSRKFKYSKRQNVVKEWLLNARNDLRHGVLPSNDRITVSEFMESYMETVAKNTLRPSTQEMYWLYIRLHINPSLGKIKLKDLGPHHLQRFYSQKIEEGLSKRTVQILHATIRRILNQAVSWGIIQKNVCKQVKAPRPGKIQYTILTREQLNTFLNAVKGHRWELIYILLVFGGFREGEVLGIMAEDCDMVNKVINVRHSVITLKGGLVIAEPKTESSKRAVSLPQVAYSELKKHLEQLVRKQGLIFTTSTGRPISPRNLIRHFKSVLVSAGLPDIRVHDLRHSHASLLLASGVNPKVVQERLGHASITLTLQTYSHVIPSLQEEAAKKLDLIMGATPA
jgi:integrase